MKLRIRSTEDRPSAALFRERASDMERAAAREAEALRRQLVAADRARQELEQRREVLVDCVVAAVPAAILRAQTSAWDNGWEAGWQAGRNGLPKTANPVRETDEDF